jgi:hypothetical protein
MLFPLSQIFFPFPFVCCFLYRILFCIVIVLFFLEGLCFLLEFMLLNVTETNILTWKMQKKQQPNNLTLQLSTRNFD